MIAELIIKYKKQLKIIVAVFMFIFAVIQLWNYFMFGTISVTTEKESLVTISRLGDDTKAGDKIFSKQGLGKLSVRVSPGNYIVSINKKNNASNSLVELKRRQKIKVDIQPPENLSYEPVLNKSTNDLSVDATGLSFLNSETETVFSVNNQNRSKETPVPSGAKEMAWTDPSYGVGISENNQFFAIDNGAYKAIPLPGSAKASDLGGFTVSNTKKVYFSLGKDIYRYTAGKGSKKIYSSSEIIPVLSASDSSIALIKPPGNDSEEEQTSIPFVEIISDEGARVAKKDIAGNKAVWSPDGNRLLVTNFFGQDSLGSSRIYDKQLNQVDILPNTRVGSTDWVDDHSLAYTVGNALWFYDTNAKKSQTITYFSAGDSILGVSADRDSRLIYFSYKQQASNKSYILRTSSDKKSFNSKFVGLSVFMPVSLDNCLIDYVNFKGRPVIVMRVFAPSLGVCRTQAEIELTQDGFNPKDFDYQPVILQAN